jgi:hypothetical protein
MTSIKKSGTNKFPYAHVKLTWGILRNLVRRG